MTETHKWNCLVMTEVKKKESLGRLSIYMKLEVCFTYFHTN